MVGTHGPNTYSANTMLNFFCNSEYMPRQHHEEITSDLRAQLAQKEKEIKRMQDMLFKLGFNIQMHGNAAGDTSLMRRRVHLLRPFGPVVLSIHSPTVV